MLKGLQPSNDDAGTVWVIGIFVGIAALFTFSWILGLISLACASWSAWKWRGEHAARWGAFILGALPLALMVIRHFGIGQDG